MKNKMDILNEKLVELLDGFSDGDWDKWQATRSSNREKRRADFEFKAQIQQIKIAIDESGQAKSFQQILVEDHEDNWSITKFDYSTCKIIVNAMHKNSDTPLAA